jgi:hypothetical protein
MRCPPEKRPKSYTETAPSIDLRAGGSMGTAAQSIFLKSTTSGTTGKSSTTRIPSV